MPIKAPRGTYDILPPASRHWQNMEENLKRTARVFGYQEIRTPLFEHTELFERGVGEGTDIVSKEMYTFFDKSGRSLTLRPEATASCARALLEHSAHAGVLPVKWFYCGPMFRYDRPQAGRYRQFWQYGLEFFGSHHPFYDAEVIAFLWNYLTSLGLKKIHLEINSVGCPNCLHEYEVALKAFYQPHLPELCGDCQNRFEVNPKRLLDCKVPSCGEIAKQAPSQLDYLDEECRTHFEQVQHYLQLANIEFVVNPRIVRGLDYYSHTAFEVIFDGLGAQNTLAGGGRYNYLVEQMGGKPTPAIGFAGGFERLLLALEEESVSLDVDPIPDAYAIAMGEEAQKALMPLIFALRNQGKKVDCDPEKSSFKAQMKAANNSQARFCLIIGEDELSSKSVILKDMESGEQQSIAMDKVSSHLLQIL